MSFRILNLNLSFHFHLGTYGLHIIQYLKKILDINNLWLYTYVHFDIKWFDNKRGRKSYEHFLYRVIHIIEILL